MSNFQRMIVIPQEEYLQLSAVQNARQPLTQQYYNLENQYQESQQIKDPYERLLSQSQTLEDMKRLKERCEITYLYPHLNLISHERRPCMKMLAPSLNLMIVAKYWIKRIRLFPIVALKI